IWASTVQRLLERAEEQGLVRISLQIPKDAELSGVLANACGLRDAVVVPKVEPRELKASLGQKAAAYFETVAWNSMRVGLTFGETLYHFVQNLEPERLRGLEIYPMAADTRHNLDDTNPNSIASIMAAKYGTEVKAFVLHAAIWRGQAIQLSTG